MAKFAVIYKRFVNGISDPGPSNRIVIQANSHDEARSIFNYQFPKQGTTTYLIIDCTKISS